MSKRPIRHRAECPGCHYRHFIQLTGGGTWQLHLHNAPSRDGVLQGICPGSQAVVPAPVEPAKGPGIGERRPDGKKTFVLPSKDGTHT